MVSLFCLGICLFLLPPVPGLPIYYVSSIVITERFVSDGGGFWLGCFVSSLFCFAIKLTAIALEQKAIGETFADSIEVKKIIGVHSPAMKAVRHILMQPGVRIDKVSVLIGGPDWPTSVLTGILRLRLADMLLGSAPVYLLIVSVVLAACLQVRAGKKDEPYAEQYQDMATVMLMGTTILQVFSMLLAGYYMQAVAEENRAEIESGRWEADPQEQEVLDALKRDEELKRQTERVTAWRFTPFFLRALLLLGSVAASGIVHILTSPFIAAFQDFTLTDKIADLPGGTAWSAVNAWGWVSVCLFVFTCATVGIHYCWSRYQVAQTSEGLQEETPLLDKTV